MTIFSTLGQVTPPSNNIISKYQGQDGLIYLLNQIITLLYTLGGLMVFFNLLISGYQYLTSGGDQQKILSAGQRITYSLYGIIFLVSSFVIAAVLGQLLFNDPLALTKPTFWKVE